MATGGRAKPCTFAVAALLCVLLSGGCGYHFVDGRAPFGAASIAVLPFQENVPLQISKDIAHTLSQRLSQQGIALAHPDNATATLRGTIEDAITTGSPVPATSGIPAYQVRIRVSCELINGQGKQLWKTEFWDDEQFRRSQDISDGSTDTLGTESNRRRAVHRLAIRVATRIESELVISSAAVAQ